jgi:hypothetical protein
MQEYQQIFDLCYHDGLNMELHQLKDADALASLLGLWKGDTYIRLITESFQSFCTLLLSEISVEDGEDIALEVSRGGLMNIPQPAVLVMAAALAR